MATQDITQPLEMLEQRIAAGLKLQAILDKLNRSIPKGDREAEDAIIAGRHLVNLLLVGRSGGIAASLWEELR